MAAERTCVATRQALPRDELVRLVASPDGQVIVDAKGTLPGRGAWVHPSSEALARLDRVKGRLERQLGAKVDPVAVAASVREATRKGVLDGLSLAAASGALLGGRDQIITALAAGRVHTLAFASDAAQRTRDALLREASDRVLCVELPFTAARLGQQAGRGPLAAVAVIDARPTRLLLRQLRRLAQLG